MLKKKLINLGLLTIVPIFVAYLIHLIWDFPVSLVSGILYLILFLFNLPNGSFMSTNSDYTIKRINPYYKVEKQDFSSLNSQALITLAILILLIIISFLIYIQQIQH